MHTDNLLDKRQKTKEINFNNTQKAFQYKSDGSLKKARLLFNIMTITPLVKLGIRLTPLLIKSGFPFKKLIKNTLFEQFVGGEALEETIPVCNRLGNYKVDVILDYGIEGGEYEDAICDLRTQEFIEVIRFASTQRNIPFISIKITGLTTFSLLEKINVLINPTHDLNIFNQRSNIMNLLSHEDKIAWEKLINRLDNICKTAAGSGIGILIDAEESWVQDSIDLVSHLMMRKFNKHKAIVYNTIQLYRHDRLQFLENSIEDSIKKDYKLAVKLVRGAYLEKETRRSEELGYTNPLNQRKEATDYEYDTSVSICLKSYNSIATIIASHNEKSNLQAAEYMYENQIPVDHPNIHFSQLYGMSDNLTFNLADAGFNVSKYLPFGKVEDIIPYLMRRAEENSSIAGQTGRELALIKKECVRRGI